MHPFNKNIINIPFLLLMLIGIMIVFSQCTEPEPVYYEPWSYSGTTTQGSVEDCSTAIPTNISTTTQLDPPGITITWDPINGASSYIIYRLDPTSNIFIQVGTNTSPTYTDSAVVTSNAYTYKISASTAACAESELSAEIIGMIDDGDACTEEFYYAEFIALHSSKTGYEFKQALHDLITNHTVISYDGLWDAMKDVDDGLYGAVTGRIGDIYNLCTISGAKGWQKEINQCTGGAPADYCNCYNREHSFPKSWWGGNDEVASYSDLFHLFPVDALVNTERNNNPYGEVGASYTNNGTGKLGNARTGLGFSATVFEPADNHKGDVARAHFYVVVRYMNEINQDIISSSWLGREPSEPSLDPWYETMLKNWHELDPPDADECYRNNRIFEKQGNRNPFIDYPEWVDKIFSDQENQGF